MSRLPAFILAFSSVLFAGCEEFEIVPADRDMGCAVGPSEIRDEALSAGVGEAIGGFIPFGEIDASVFSAVSSDDAPAGVALSLEEGGVVVDGSIAAAGAYAFAILVEADPGNACAAWARYDVTLTAE